MTTPFQEAVYTLCAQIPKGKVTTYKALAEALGHKGYQAIGSALNKNPYAPSVPCHRVVNSDGRLGGFAHGSEEKRRMLEKEGLVIERRGKKEERVANFRNVLKTFK